MEITAAAKGLEKAGFKVSCFETAEKAAAYICEETKGKTVGIGGSMTVKEMGLFEKLSENNTVYWHWINPEAETRDKANASQVYISSANAIAATGEIINIDGSGNRVASIMYGHEKVYIVAGINKLEENYEKAYCRARNIASPLNAKRLGVKTPCAESEECRCYDCSSPQRICRGVSVIMRPMRGVKETEIILINEKLGF